MKSLDRLPTFAREDVFHVVVESPRGSTIKLKYDADLQAMSVSRPLPLGVRFPYDWGFVPSTRAEDGDPVDVLLLWDVASFPGVVVPSRAIAVVQVEQNRADGHGRVRNDRILAMPIETRREIGLAMDGIPTRIRRELEQFFLAATALEGKDVTILSWAGADAALALLRRAT